MIFTVVVMFAILELLKTCCHTEDYDKEAEGIQKERRSGRDGNSHSTFIYDQQVFFPGLCHNGLHE